MSFQNFEFPHRFRVISFFVKNVVSTLAPPGGQIRRVVMFRTPEVIAKEVAYQPICMNLARSQNKEKRFFEFCGKRRLKFKNRATSYASYSKYLSNEPTPSFLRPIVKKCKLGPVFPLLPVGIVTHPLPGASCLATPSRLRAALRLPLPLGVVEGGSVVVVPLFRPSVASRHTPPTKIPPKRCLLRLVLPEFSKNILINTC